MSVRRSHEAGSGSEDNSALKSSKDRECPFCHQAFTSSSLGRHLDLFIRPHNPKPPDGVHKVDEIRKIRGRITRRQPKGKARSVDSPQSPYLIQEIRERSQLAPNERAVVTSIEPKDTPSSYVNAMDWRSTGVINGVGDARRVEELPAEVPQRPSPTLEEQVENGKAAELALRDLVDNINASQSVPKPMFDVDVLSLSFPGLCLALLPAPTSLFSTTPFSDDYSWSLDPPGETQRMALDRLMYEKMGRRRDNKVLQHVEDSYAQWQKLYLKEKAEIWALEVMRIWARTKKSNDDLRNQLAIAQQRIAHLESEYELLSRCQLPREKLLAAPATIPIIADLPELDAQTLIQKWRTNVRAVARPRKIRRTETMINKQPSSSTLRSDMVLHGSVFNIGGPMTRTEEGTP